MLENKRKKQKGEEKKEEKKRESKIKQIDVEKLGLFHHI